MSRKSPDASPIRWIGHESAVSPCSFVTLFVSLNVAANAILLSIVVSGNVRTVRLGLPSISTMLDDNIDLSIAFGFLVCFFLAVRTLGVVNFHLVNNGYTKFALIVGILQIASFNMIPIVRVSEYNNLHFAFALLTVIFSVLREVALLYNRYMEPSSSTVRKILPLNFIIILLIVFLGGTYAIGIESSEYIESYQPFAVLEYITFFLIANCVALEILDLPSSSVRGSNRSLSSASTQSSYTRIQNYGKY
jgi:hypothetical protein